MTNAVFIPKRINVGFCKREDTYTKRLAYVIYYDHKGKLRKETSWQNWRDHKIPNEEFDNNPTEGFVLNKKVGGDRYDWNPRQTYARVHDPRGFEFEITVPNLLYILENTNSIKGKGLEGKFVYGWDAGELLLIPEAAPEYSKYVEFSDVITKSVKAKDLVLGGTYKTNKNEEVVYLGRFDYHKTYWGNKPTANLGKHYFFTTHKHDWLPLTIMKSLSGRIVQEVSNVPVSNYAKLMDQLEGKEEYSPYDPSKDKYVTPKATEIETHRRVFFNVEGRRIRGDIYKRNEAFVIRYVCMEHSNYYSSDTSPEVVFLKKLGAYHTWNDSCSGLPAQYLIDTLGLTIKKEYLANGKTKK